MTKVGYDLQAALTDKPTGLAVYVQNLFDALRAHPSEVELSGLRGRYAGELSTWQRYYHDRYELPRLAHQAKVDVIHQPAFSCPPGKKRKVIWTLHDLRPVTSREKMSLTATLFWREWLPYSARFADMIVCTTDHGAHEAAQVLGVPSAKVRVIGMGVSPAIMAFRSNLDRLNQALERHQIRSPYFSCVATLQPVKNIPFLVQAFAKLRQELSLPHQLVVIGNKNWGYPAVAEAIKQAGLTEGQEVILTGFVSDEEKWEITAASEAFLFPSLNEGYGLPPLEAQALGVPVISSSGGALPSVLGDSVVYANPTDQGTWLAAYQTLRADPALIVERGRLNVRRFDWAAIASQWQSLYREVANY